MKNLKLITLCMALNLLASCANIPKMYQKFDADKKPTYSTPTDAIKAVNPSIDYIVGEKRTISFSEADPVLLVEQNTGNKGYFKVVQFKVASAATYVIRGLLNCRCLGKLSGKNAVVARLYLWDAEAGKVFSSMPGLQKDHSWAGDDYYNQLEVELKPGNYLLIVAVDNSAKGGPLFSVNNYGASSVTPIPVFYSISAAPEGNVDLIIQDKSLSQKH